MQLCAMLSESPRKRNVVGANLPINVHRQNPMCVAAVRLDAVEVVPVRNDCVIVSLWFIGEN